MVLVFFNLFFMYLNRFLKTDFSIFYKNRKSQNFDPGNPILAQTNIIFVFAVKKYAGTIP